MVRETSGASPQDPDSPRNDNRLVDEYRVRQYICEQEKSMSGRGELDLT